jgi:hypothetical protein
MRKHPLLVLGFVFVMAAPHAQGYVEAPYSLGQMISEASHIMLVEVVRVNKEKNLVIYKKVKDIKGKQPDGDIKHNIGQRGFHQREWQNIKDWAEVGKKAVFFHNGSASETCMGTYWYQCYNEGEWWGMSHAEPFLLRTFYGDPEKLAGAVERILKGEEVVVPCLADGSKEQLHQRKGKVQQLKASLKRLNYDAKRDFVAFGGDGEDVPEYKTVNLLAESSAGWKFLPAAQASADAERWQRPEFDDAKWTEGKAPIGYGEAEINKRQGATIKEQGQDMLFRRIVEVPAELLAQKGVLFELKVASDDSAVVLLNGEKVDDEGGADHEFAYWNREIELQPKHFKPGRNVIAVRVKNKQGSSDLYLDLHLAAQVPLPKPAKANAPASK